jgi:hypothetical protein
MSFVNNEWDNRISQTFAKQNQSSNSAVTILKRVYFLETVMIFYDICERFLFNRIIPIIFLTTNFFVPFYICAAIVLFVL